jgi:hypothetical protein
MYGVPVIWADLNDVYMRSDGLYQCWAPWVDGLSLRDPVVIDQDGCRMNGIVCGLMDRGRGKYLMIEVDPYAE